MIGFVVDLIVYASQDGMMSGGDSSAHHCHWRTEVVPAPPALRKMARLVPVPPAGTPRPVAGPWLRMFGLRPPYSIVLYCLGTHSMCSLFR